MLGSLRRESSALLDHLSPRYSGSAEPGMTNRRPGKYLKTA